MFLKDSNNFGVDLTLIPESQWKEAFEKFLPIGKVLGMDVFIYPNPDNADEEGELLLGPTGACSGQLLLKSFPSLEIVLGWYESVIRSKASGLLSQAEWVSNVAKWGSVTPPLKLEMPQWQPSEE